MSSTRLPFDSFLTKLSAAAGDDASAPIKDICIKRIKTALDSAKKWEEGITDDFAKLTRTVDELLGDKQIITKQPSVDNESEGTPSNFLSTENGKKLVNRVEEIASRVSHDFPSSATTSSPSFSSKAVLKEVLAHEEELQRMAEEIKARDLGPTFLQMIYSDLDPQLKRCLLYFSVFPENRVIKRRVMIYWWIGEGLVAPTRDGRRTAEQVGEECFKTLISSRLIEPICQKHSKTAKYCKIYPWVRQMLVSEAKESEFFTFDQEDRPTNSSESKRACLAAMKKEDPVKVSPELNPNELQSLFNVSAQYLRCDKEQLARLKAISALQLGRWQYSSPHHIEVEDTKFLDGLQSLKRLRYLSLQGTSTITKLPETIAGLTHLLILDLRSCHNLENVTPAVTSIKSLTHLDVSECYLLDKMPQGIGSITNLQVLQGFVVGSTRSTDPCRLSELTQLKLRKLSIRIASEVHLGEDLSELSKIDSLLSLKITWGQKKSSPPPIAEPKTSRMKTMKGLRSLKASESMKESTVRAFSIPNLEKLVLECVPDDESVSWLTPRGFTKLKRLYIAGGKLSQLSPVTENDGWNVEILRLKFLKDLKLEWVDLKGKLPRLRCAQVYECPQVKSSIPVFDEKGYWVRNDEEASSSSMAGTSATV